MEVFLSFRDILQGTFFGRGTFFEKGTQP